MPKIDNYTFPSKIADSMSTTPEYPKPTREQIEAKAREIYDMNDFLETLRQLARFERGEEKDLRLQVYPGYEPEDCRLLFQLVESIAGQNDMD